MSCCRRALPLQKGFTLIELMIVVAIVGILAALALPAYQDYTVRSKISEVMIQIGACRTAAFEYMQSAGVFASSTQVSGCSSGTKTKYMAAGLAVSAEGVITSGAIQNTSSGADGNMISMVPTSDPDRTVAYKTSDFTDGKPVAGWACYTSASADAYRYFPANCRQASPTGL
jgi:type IV pilus assembly protein PilA